MTEIIKLSQRDLSIMIVVIIIGITCSFGIDMHLPSLPSNVTHFDSTVGTGQLSVSLYVMSMTVCLLIYGPISDRLGRKPVILFGQGFINVNTIAGALSSYRSMGGTASALYGSLQSFIGFSVSLIISTGGFHSVTSLAISYGALSLIGLLLLYFQRDMLS